jgi:glycosyltransferase involved in cell wall biosynthesis
LKSARAQCPWLRQKGALLIEWFALRSSHRVLYVSNAMRRVIEERRPFARRRFGGVFPCLGDSTKFYFDPALRERKRAELDLTPHTRLLAYAGHMQPYQRFADVARLYALCKAANSNVRLLVVTPKENHPIAKAELQKAGAIEGAIIVAAAHEEVCGLLNAADAGVLLREPSPVNAGAWPVKFAEYLLCGLPVAISAGIGDCSELAVRHRLGVIVEGLDDLEKASADILRVLDEKNTADSRRESAELAKKLFASETRASAFAAFIRSV